MSREDCSHRGARIYREQNYIRVDCRECHSVVSCTSEQLHRLGVPEGSMITWGMVVNASQITDSGSILTGSACSHINHTVQYSLDGSYTVHCQDCSYIKYVYPSFGSLTAPLDSDEMLMEEKKPVCKCITLLNGHHSECPMFKP